MATYYYQRNADFYSRRIIVFVVAVAVQIALFVVFETGMASRVLRVVAPPIQTDIVQEVQKHDQPPPPPPPKMERPPVEVPPPDVAINVPVETTTTAITVTPKAKPVPHAAPAPHRAVITYAELDMRGSGSTDDYYPDISRRLDEQGTALVYACAGANGRIEKTPRVEKSSGSLRLDAAAIRYASHARYRPATEDGRPVPGCTRFRVTFTLTN